MLTDLRYGARALLRTPGFTLLAIVTLALGIGANTAIFSVVNGVLLSPLAYRDPQQLVTLLHNGNGPVAPANYLDWRDQSRSFDAMVAGATYTVVGICADAKQIDWADTPDPEVYLAALQNHDFLSETRSHLSYLTLVVRTAGNPADAAAAVKQTVWSFDRNLPISQVLTMDKAVADKTAEPRLLALLLAIFAGVALLLAAVGIYGVMSYAIARRTHEIGIRLALGASRGEVLRMVLRQGLTQALAGSAIGVGAALLLARLMTRLLFGVKPQDPLTFGLVALVLGTAALAAICVPARRAVRIDPMAALRQE